MRRSALLTREQLLDAAVSLAMECPVDHITYKDVADRCDVHWTTVRRHLGTREEMREEIRKEIQARIPDLARQAVHQDTRSRLLKAAAEVFAQQGYAGATLDQIGHAAGLTKGAVYWHFTSKSDLYLALLESKHSDLFHTLPGNVERIMQAEDTGDAWAAWLADIVLDSMMDDRRQLLFYEFVASSRDRSVKEKLNQLYQSSYDQIGRVVEELQERCAIMTDAEPRNMALLLSSLMNGLILNAMLSPDDVTEKRLIETIRLIWTGIGPRDQRTTAHT